MGQSEVCLLPQAKSKLWGLPINDANHPRFAPLSEIVLSLAGSAAFDCLVLLWNNLARDKSSVGVSLDYK